MGKAKKAWGKPRATVIRVANQKGGKSSTCQAILATSHCDRSFKDNLVANIVSKAT
jgi:hypothetical protein